MTILPPPMATDKEKNEPEFVVRDRRFWKNEAEESPSNSAQKTSDPFIAISTDDSESIWQQQLADREHQIAELTTALRAVREEHRRVVERLQRQVQNEVLGFKAEFVREFLESVDNLQRCAAVTQDPLTRQGIELILNELHRTLNTMGVEPITTQGQRFNPDTCEAVAMEETDKAENDNQIIEEYSRGYRLGERLIRPARVRVFCYRTPVQTVQETPNT